MDQVRMIVSSLNGFVERIVKKLVLDIVANLQRSPMEGGTPVDTGWARANWVPRIGSSTRATAGTRKQAEAGQLSNESAAGVAEVATGYRLPRGAVYISNNVPYIGILDLGHGSRPVTGFVGRAVRKAVLMVVRP